MMRAKKPREKKYELVDHTAFGSMIDPTISGNLENAQTTSVYVLYPYYEVQFENHTDWLDYDGNWFLDLTYHTYTPLYDDGYYISE